MWFHGPKFLEEDENSWPKNHVLEKTNEEVCNCLLYTSKSHKFTRNVEYFLCCRRLYKVLSLCLLYKENLKSVVRNSKLSVHVDFECVQKSKIVLYKYAQKCDFRDEIWCIQNDKHIQKGSKLKQTFLRKS